MRDPIEVLKHLSGKSQDREYRFERIYRNLYNPEFYWLAYRNIYANGGSTTPGVDGTTMDGMSEKRIIQLIETLKDQSYQPCPARRTYIEKRNNPAKKRPLGIPSGNDKLVQEVVRMILESIYEPNFSEHSHGFRPKRSCHTALMEIRRTFTGAIWFVEGDITACFDSFDHNVLIELLRRRIQDEKFISLMWKFLKAGYMEQWVYHQTYSGTPQGSGMSPILANIYLHELDRYMESTQKQYAESNTASHQPNNREYNNLKSAIYRYKKANEKDWQELSAEEREERAKVLRDMNKELLGMKAKDACNPAFKSVRYVRYADDFIIGVIGSKADAESIKLSVKDFLSEKLSLTLSEEKTKITHSTQRVRFLGYDVTVTRDESVKRQKNGTKRRVYSGNVNLYVPHEKWESKLREYEAIRITVDDKSKDHWRASRRPKLINSSDIYILTRYNSEVRGLYNYYCIANNAWVIGKFGGLMKHSMMRTFAAKYRTKVSVIKKRYVRNGNFTVCYPTKAGVKQAIFYNQGYGRKRTPMREPNDTLPAHRRYEMKNSLKARLKGKTCELCGKPSAELEMHQVKGLKSLSGKYVWELVMLDKRRITLAVCRDCHQNIHDCE